ncbi:MAG: hypothetical protein AAFW64_09720 [Pseudomonadota bacterium]
MGDPVVNQVLRLRAGAAGGPWHTGVAGWMGKAALEPFSGTSVVAPE